MRSGRIAAALVSALAAGVALDQTQGWAPLYSDPEIVVTVHEPVGEGRPLGQIWVHVEYSRRTKLNGVSFRSERYLAQVDCSTGMIIRTNWELFAHTGLAGKSRVTAPKDGMAWVITPDSIDAWVARAACAKPVASKPPGG